MLQPERRESEKVECLGRTFESDDARRAYFTECLHEKLKDPAFRATPGFPIADDEAILRLSDPPYFTACPNPWLADFARVQGQPGPKGAPPPTDTYRREPLAVDSSEGKTDPIYTAHSYHTKVPHKAIMRAILHYTEPGDLVLDGFAGSGMTGVAAQLCAQPGPTFRDQIELERKAAGLPPPAWGARRAILNDLGPAATFIAANYNLPFDLDCFEQTARRLLAELEAEVGWMYETTHVDGTKGRINYTVWSEVFACPNCGSEIVYLDVALDKESERVKDIFSCPNCHAELIKERLIRRFEKHVDPATGQIVDRVTRRPVLINYNAAGGRYQKRTSESDLALIQKIEALSLPSAVPTNEIPFMHMTHQRARMAAFGITHVHQFYLPRAAQALGTLWAKAEAVEDARLREILLFFVEQAIWGMSVLNRYGPTHFSQVNRQLNGVYYVASQLSEVNPWYILDGKLNRLVATFRDHQPRSGDAIVATQDAAALCLPPDSIDYIFTDPPFGENIYYADLNFLVESWHHVWTNPAPEAIVDQAKRKGLPEYQRLMQRCFETYARALKPGRWMTVVFHNSRNSVWNAIQEALGAAGFVVADVRTLDKQQGSYRQVTSPTLKQDLIISAYKPIRALEDTFRLAHGGPEGAWDFVRAHLRQLPVAVARPKGALETVAERLGYFLFDRMVAFHVQRGVTVPLSAAEFYAGLKQRFPERDGMYFLPEQVVAYDAKRLQAGEVAQLRFLVVDEGSAIQWLRQQLRDEPQTYADLFPKFLREIGGWSKTEKPLEMKELLDENFLIYDGKGPIPDQIWNWMTTRSGWSGWLKGKDRRQPDAAMLAEAKDRWYVADPGNAEDLEKKRERNLLKEFEEYRLSKSRKLKVFRLEAVRAGFKKAWADHDYQTILSVAEKVPDDVFQEDPKLLMWYDQALTRTGG